MTENGALLTPFEKANGVPLTFYEPPFSKGRGRQFIGQRTPAVRGARDERAQRRARAVTENGALLTPFEKDGLRQQAKGGFALKR